MIPSAVEESVQTTSRGDSFSLALASLENLRASGEEVLEPVFHDGICDGCVAALSRGPVEASAKVSH